MHANVSVEYECCRCLLKIHAFTHRTFFYEFDTKTIHFALIARPNS
jgi:hypothetical protein